MRAPQAPPETAKPSITQADRGSQLIGWRLAAARVMWLGLALGTLTLFVAALPSRQAQTQADGRNLAPSEARQ
jgi:hypothetical protein